MWFWTRPRSTLPSARPPLLVPGVEMSVEEISVGCIGAGKMARGVLGGLLITGTYPHMAHTGRAQYWVGTLGGSAESLMVSGSAVLKCTCLLFTVFTAGVLQV